MKGTGQSEPLTVGLHFKMDPGWKVYALPPEGEAQPLFGQPPEVDWSASENLEDVELLWPPGKWQGEGAYRIYVYDKSVIIPLKVNLLDESKPLKLKGMVRFFGCSETCRPFQQEVDLMLSPQEAHPTPEAPAIHHYEAQAEEFESQQDLKEAASLSFMILIALLGGLILNFMPCVLPVLSLKIMGLIKSHHPKFKLKFLATSAGILVSFLMLAVIMVSFKAIGVTLGWGFHFQQPLFLGGMATLMMIFSLSLYGVFEIPLPSFMETLLSIQGRGIMKDFLSGMFATLLATPCSAPFVGTAISFALSQGSFRNLHPIYGSWSRIFYTLFIRYYPA